MPTEGREQDIVTDQELEHITHQQVLDALKEAVEERGADFKYPINWRDSFEENRDEYLGQEDVEDAAYGNCQNYIIVGDGEVRPACIVGYVYDKLGILDKLVDADRVADGYYRIASVVSIFARGTGGAGNKRTFGGIVLDDVDIAALVQAQEAQDTEHSWGEALEQAEPILERAIREQAEQQAQFEADFGGENVGE